MKTNQGKILSDIKSFLDLMDSTNNDNEGFDNFLICKGYDILSKFEELMGG